MNREIKHFFAENNSLNKGFISNHKSSKQLEGFRNVLPTPEVLAAYEEIMPGTMARLLDLTQQEQNHQHAIEQSEVFIRAKFEMIGKLFFVLTVAIIGYVTVNLAQSSLNHAVIFASVAFLSILAMSLNLHLKNKCSENPSDTPKKESIFLKNDHKNQIDKDALDEDNSSSSLENSRDKNNYRRSIYKRKK